MKKTWMLASASAVLMLSVACGGIFDPNGIFGPSKGLEYTDAPSGDFRLICNHELSTQTRVVLDVVGKSGQLGRGLTFSLNVDPAKAQWVKVSEADSQLAQNGSLNLGTGVQAFKVNVNGGKLSFLAGQKGETISAKDLGHSLARVALEFKSGSLKGPVTLTSEKAHLLPENGAPKEIQIFVGNLNVK